MQKQGFQRHGGRENDAHGAPDWMAATISTETYRKRSEQAQWPERLPRVVAADDAAVSLQRTASGRSAPAAAELHVQGARAVERAGTFRGAEVTRVADARTLRPAEDRLGVRERLAQEDHSAVGRGGDVLFHVGARRGARPAPEGKARAASERSWALPVWQTVARMSRGCIKGNARPRGRGREV